MYPASVTSGMSVMVYPGWCNKVVPWCRGQGARYGHYQSGMTRLDQSGMTRLDQSGMTSLDQSGAVRHEPWTRAMDIRQ